MVFTGRIKQVLPLRSGTSQRGEWKALPFIFEYFENASDRYADAVLLETLDTNVIPQVKEGAEVKIGFGHRTREHEGRIYNEMRIYRFELINQQQQQQAVSNDPFAQGAQEGGNDDLPY